MKDRISPKSRSLQNGIQVDDLHDYCKHINFGSNRRDSTLPDDDAITTRLSGHDRVLWDGSIGGVRSDRETHLPGLHTLQDHLHPLRRILQLLQIRPVQARVDE